MKEIEIYTDGSCKGNPGPGGWAAILFEKKSQQPFLILRGREILTTNNRMEMLAVIQALRYIIKNNFQTSALTLYSDSNLIVQTINSGWKKKANLDLWLELNELNEQLDIKYVWVRGHAKNKWNNECDKIAQSEAMKAGKSLQLKI